MSTIKKAGLIEAVEAKGRGKKKRLGEMGVPRSTYYGWKQRYDEKGSAGLERQARRSTGALNKLADAERERVVAVALNHPELSSRLLSVKITEEEPFSVSESTVFRLLKSKGLIQPRPLEEAPAAKAFHRKTTRPDELWQSDATTFFVVGWGYYKAIPVLDDYSRKVLACPLKRGEDSASIADAVELALERARAEGHLVDKLPTLLTDNGAGFTGEVLDEYLKFQGIKHVFGKPYHPQTQGKVERFHKRLKGNVCLWVYCTPEELEAAIRKAVAAYNVTPHESLKNVSPDEVYAGRQEAVLRRREEKKRLTLIRRKQYNLARRAEVFGNSGGQVSQNG